MPRITALSLATMPARFRCGGEAGRPARPAAARDRSLSPPPRSAAGRSGHHFQTVTGRANDLGASRPDHCQTASPRHRYLDCPPAERTGVRSKLRLRTNLVSQKVCASYLPPNVTGLLDPTVSVI